MYGLGVAARLSKDRRASSAVEFALILPVLLGILFGITEFGVVMYNKIEMTDAARAAARQLSIGRSNATVRTTTLASFYAAAPSFVDGSATIATFVNGAECKTDTLCMAALNAAVGGQATVSVSKACRLFTTYNILPGCTLQSTTASRIE